MNDAVMIAMSGGVDSAVAAHFISNAAKKAAGVTMRHFKACPESDARDAAALCERLSIPHFIADLEKEFEHEVILPFINAYESGETPNPCVLCNKKIKFGALLAFASSQGFSDIATGHYARIEQSNHGRFLLRRALDEAKDQTYFLYTLTQGILAHTKLPLGDL
jgi:tRNA-specific 2-thiouridylase